MKILIIGAAGTIGSRIKEHFEDQHQVLTAGRNSGSYQVDLEDSNSIQQLLENTGALDAIVCTAGEAKWAPFEALSEEDYYIGIKSKLMGQVNLVRIGRKYLNPGGSITLSTGILADDPVPMTASAAMVNGALHSYVKAAVLEIKEDIRLNVVSLGMVEDAYEKYKDVFPGHNPVPTRKVVNAFVRSILRSGNGEIIREYE